MWLVTEWPGALDLRVVDKYSVQEEKLGRKYPLTFPYVFILLSHCKEKAYLQQFILISQSSSKIDAFNRLDLNRNRNLLVLSS